MSLAGKPIQLTIPVSGLLLGYLFLALDLDLVPFLSPYDEKRLLQLCLIAAALAVLIVSRRPRTGVIASMERLPATARAGIVLLFALGIVSALRAVSPMYALVELALLGSLLLMALTVAAPEPRMTIEREITLGCWLLAATAGVYLIEVLAAYSATLFANAPLLPLELFTNINQIRLLNQLQTWTLPLLTLGVLLAKDKALARVLLVVIAAGWWMIALLSGGRGTLLGQAVATVAVLILFGSAARPWLKTHVLLAAAGMLAFVLLFVLVPGLGDAGADGGARTGLSRDLTSASHRLRLWSDSLALIRGAPLLGIGPMHFVCEQVHRPRFGGSPHNIVLQIATEWGLPAAILFLFLAVWAAIGWTRWARGEARRGHDPAILVGLSASLYAAAAHSMVSSLFNTPMSQMMLVVLAGWTLRLHSGSVQRHPPAPNQGRLATATLAAVVLTVVTVLVWGIGSVNTAHARLVESWTNGGGSIIPRLWLHGSICEDP